ncbi:DUF4037 domain-containing protein [Longimicrobium sp.]|jgi:hypothetical protein|uniref:DUF4037 domain-containing protein n=1 Tax=Longimicrobium sp. TaxID=2029185 RepID=UPI002F94DD30
MTRPEEIAASLLPMLRTWVAGEYGIAIGGSYAKGSGDSLSDVDIYLFANEVLPAARRDEAVVAELGVEARPESWGADDPFVQGGTDFWHVGQRVECWLRSTREVDRTLRACVGGEVGREYVVWTVMGFLSYTALADVHSMMVVDDPHGVLARWKAAVATYPEALRQNILDRFMPEAAFWPENFHYRTAVQRGDVIYTSAIVQQVLQALIQVVFALNRSYFPGEKRLAHAMEKLSVQPSGFARRVQELLMPPSVDVAGLETQRRGVADLVAEMRALAFDTPGSGASG